MTPTATEVLRGSPQNLSDLGFHARVYAYAGIKVFPLWGIIDGPDGLQCSCYDGRECGSPGKHPRLKPAHRKGDALYGKCFGKCGKEGHGLYDATTDLDTIARWDAAGLWGGIGKPAHGSGVAVLDVDPKNGGDESFEKLHTFVLDRTGADLMDTLIQNTGRHKGRRGMHLEFAAPEGGVSSKARTPFGADMPGLDTRGIGGYTVVWPTLHISGVEYEYLDWTREPAPWPAIMTALMNPPKVAPPKVAPLRERGTSPRYAESALDKELEIVRSAKEGTRNDTLNAAAFNLGQLVGAGQLSEHVVRDELLSAAVSAGLPSSDIKTIESGLRSGMASPRQAGRAA
jgi:hypothetical protein